MSGTGTSRSDAGVIERRDQILCEMSARETPWVGVSFAVLVVLFDVASYLSGLTESVGYYLSDVVQGGYFLVVSFLVARGHVPARSVPMLFASAVVVSNAALNYQFALHPADATLAVIMICLSAVGPLTLMWRIFVPAVGLMLVMTTITLMMYTPGGGESLVITAFMAAGISAVLLIGRARSATVLAQATMTIEAIATRDPLTALLNRHGLAEAARSLKAVAARAEEDMFVIFIDIVGLKRVNDAFGHQIGDLAIQRCAAAVEAISRDSDLAARWGGDEFVVLGLGPEPDSREYAARLTAAIDLSGLEGRWDGEVSVGTSADHRGDVEALITAADKAMYEGRPGRPLS